jgi:hypothetical protein
LNHHRHDASHEIERYFVDLRVPVHPFLFVNVLPVIEDCAVENVLQSGLKMGDEIRVHEDRLVLIADDIAVALEDDMIKRERAGLVGAQDIHRAEILDRIQPLDDDFFPGHEDRTP